MKTITTKTDLFEFDELSEDAKEVARNSYRECVNEDFDVEFLYDDFVTIGEIIGIEFDTKSIPLMNGDSRKEPLIYWSGFCSQGDGACFEGWYSYSKGWKGKLLRYAPMDKELMRIGQTLQDAQARCNWDACAKINHRGRYYHSGCMEIDFEYLESDFLEDIEQALRDFADWMYSVLEKEYEYQMSDECIDEYLRDGIQDFLASGQTW